MAIDFSTRATTPELMDDPTAPRHDVEQSLREIAVINHLLGGNSLTLDGLEQLLKERTPTAEPIRILDLGCGGGNMLRLVADWAKRKGHNVQLTGVDWNPVMTDYAAARSTAYPNLGYLVASVWDDAWLAQKPHIVMNSLFCHHFDAPELARLVARMHQGASLGVVINDLHRHPLAYYSIQLLTRLFSKSPLVRYDAGVSVLRSLSRAEWLATLKEAGCAKFSLRWRWAFRWQLVIPTA